MEMGHSYTVKVVTKLVQYINCTILHIYTSLKYHNYDNVNIDNSFVQKWLTENILRVLQTKISQYYNTNYTVVEIYWVTTTL